MTPAFPVSPRRLHAALLTVMSRRTSAQRRHARTPQASAVAAMDGVVSHSNSCTSAARSPSPDAMLFPQPMEIAFSLDAGSFSSDLFESAAAATCPFGPLPNAFVICFEDVLVPIKWMAQHLDLRPTTKSILEAKDRAMRSAYLHESLAHIEDMAIQVLTAVSAKGPICILSDQSARFAEAVCQAFFPRLAYCLASPQVLPNVQVIGAPRKFQTVHEKATWRIHLLQALVKERLFAGSPHLLLDPNAGRFGLIVASPHQVDAMACSKALEVAPFLIPKSLRVANARHLVALDQFLLHLQTLSQWLSESAPCTSPFSVSL